MRRSRGVEEQFESTRWNLLKYAGVLLMLVAPMGILRGVI